MEYIRSFFSKVKELTSNLNNYNVGSHVMKYLNKETVPKKDSVKELSSNLNNYNVGSHVMKYLNKDTIPKKDSVEELSSNFNKYKYGYRVMKHLNEDIIKIEKDLVNEGFDPITANVLAEKINFANASMGLMRSRDVPIVNLWAQYKRAEENSVKQAEFREYIMMSVHRRMFLDEAVEKIRLSLFGPTKFFDRRAAEREVAEAEKGFDIRRVGQENECVQKMVRVFEGMCGYPVRPNRNLVWLFGDICAAGSSRVDVIKAFADACRERKVMWHELDETLLAA